MSSKRSAGYELNRDNWNEELPKEEAGSWKPISEEERKARPILKAKRSLTNKSTIESSSPFGGITLGASPATNFNLSSSPFSCFSFAPKAATPMAQSAAPVSNTIPKLAEDQILGESSSNENTATSSENSLNPVAKGKMLLQERKRKLLEEKERIENELKDIENEEALLLQNSSGESGDSEENKGNSSNQSGE